MSAETTTATQVATQSGTNIKSKISTFICSPETTLGDVFRINLLRFLPTLVTLIWLSIPLHNTACSGISFVHDTSLTICQSMEIFTFAYYGFYMLITGGIFWTCWQLIVKIQHVWWKQLLFGLFAPVTLVLISIVWLYALLRNVSGIMAYRSVTLPLTIPIACLPSFVYLIIYSLLADRWENAQRAKIRVTIEGNAEVTLDDNIKMLLTKRSGFFKAAIFYLAFITVVVSTYFFCQFFTVIFEQVRQLGELAQVQTIMAIGFNIIIFSFKQVAIFLASRIDSFLLVKWQQEVKLRELCSDDSRDVFIPKSVQVRKMPMLKEPAKLVPIATMFGDLFYALFYRNLFLSINRVVVFVLITIALALLDIVSNLVMVSRWFYILKTRLGQAIKKAICLVCCKCCYEIEEYAAEQQTKEQVDAEVAEFQKAYITQHFYRNTAQISSITSFILCFAWLYFGYNQPFYPFMELFPIDQVYYVFIFAGVSLVTEIIVATILRVGFKLICGVGSTQSAVLTLRDIRIWFVLLLICLHVTQDVYLARNKLSFCTMNGCGIEYRANILFSANATSSM